MSYSDIVATIAMIVSITAVPASGYLSYRFAIKGEKRKEFNAVGDVIRQKLREQLRLAEDNIYPGNSRYSISQSEMDAFVDLHQAKYQQTISSLWDDYSQSLKSSIRIKNEWNDIEFAKPELVRSSIEKILPYCQRK